jgi:hypothetical protein
MLRYPVNSPILRQDPVLPLFFVNEVPHPYCRGFEGQDFSSYANPHNNTLYYVLSCPYHGFFRYYSSAWAASTMVQGASMTSPTESLQDLVLKWFAFGSQYNVITSPYLEPELGVDRDFSKCFWESLYLPITTVQRARSILRLDVWRTGNNGGCPILWVDPEFNVLYNTLPPHLTSPLQQRCPITSTFQWRLQPAHPVTQRRTMSLPHTWGGGGTVTPQQHTNLMGGGVQPPFHANMGGSPAPSQVYQYHHPAMYPYPSASPSDVPSYVHVSPPSRLPKAIQVPTLIILGHTR